MPCAAQNRSTRSYKSSSPVSTNITASNDWLIAVDAKHYRCIPCSSSFLSNARTIVRHLTSMSHKTNCGLPAEGTYPCPKGCSGMYSRPDGAIAHARRCKGGHVADAHVNNNHSRPPAENMATFHALASHTMTPTAAPTVPIVHQLPPSSADTSAVQASQWTSESHHWPHRSPFLANTSQSFSRSTSRTSSPDPFTVAKINDTGLMHLANLSGLEEYEHAGLDHVMWPPGGSPELLSTSIPGDTYYLYLGQYEGPRPSWIWYP